MSAATAGIRFARRLDHPHIIKVDACGQGWLAMELVDGGTGPSCRPDRSACGAGPDRRCAGLHASAWHRALRCKPSNILVSLIFSVHGAVLIDFGVAHAVAEEVGRRPAHIEASLPYSAPELLHGQAPSAATDEYALACTAFELITGSPPFTATTSMGLMDEQLHSPPRSSPAKSTGCHMRSTRS